jgi:hypothetical protein
VFSAEFEFENLNICMSVAVAASLLSPFVEK